MSAHRLAAALLLAAVVLPGCGWDPPQSMTTPAGAPVVGYPDTVEVLVRGDVSANGAAEVRVGRPTLVQRMWLWKHAYVRVGSELDSSATATAAPDGPEGDVGPAYYRLRYRRAAQPRLDR